MRTSLLRGLPTTVFASLAAMASSTAERCAAGTRTRRIAVHFCPALTVISRATSRTSRSNSAVPGAASGPRIAAFRLSASTFTRVELRSTAAWPRMRSAVSADPVKDTTSAPVTWSSRSPALPQTTESAPSGSTPAFTTSSTMRWVSHAVAVAGLASTGTPESSAGAAFSHSPHAGKLKALIRIATPRNGWAMCSAWKASSLARRTISPSLR